MTIKVRVWNRPDRKNLQLIYIDPMSGRTVSKSAKTDNPKDAERAAFKWELELKKLNGILDSDWKNFRNRYEDEHLATISKSARNLAIYSLNRFEKHVGQPKNMRSITTSVISQFASKLREEGLSEQTVGMYLRTIQASFNWAEKIGILDRAPKFFLPKRRGGKGRPLTFREVLRFFQSIRQVVPAEHRPAIIQLVKIMWLGGFRLSEAWRLDFENPPVQVNFNSKIPSIVWSEGGQKSGKSESTPMPPDLARLLRRDPVGRAVKTTLSKRMASDYLSKIGSNANIKVSSTKFATAHDFRRTFGQRWALRVHPFVLKAMMRHSDLNTTLTYYVDLEATDLGNQIWEAVRETVRDGNFDSKNRYHRPR